MYVPFEQLAASSRVWIYQAGREFSNQEAAEIQARAEAFAGTWSAHGKPLHASGKLFYNRFLVLAADTAMESASGCSIDSSVQFVRELESAYATSFFDRSKLAFQTPAGVETFALTEMPVAVAAGKITAQTPYFDNLVTDARALATNWLKPAGDSWLIKYF